MISVKGLRKPPPAKPGEINYDLLDRFTAVHFGIGMAYGWFDFGIVSVVALAVTWEIVENPLKAYVPFIFPHGTADTWRNIFGDFTAVLLGWAVSSHYF